MLLFLFFIYLIIFLKNTLTIYLCLESKHKKEYKFFFLLHRLYFYRQYQKSYCSIIKRYILYFLTSSVCLYVCLSVYVGCNLRQKCFLIFSPPFSCIFQGQQQRIMVMQLYSAFFVIVANTFSVRLYGVQSRTRVFLRVLFVQLYFFYKGNSKE